MGIILKSSAEIARMRAAGRVVNAVLDALEARCVPGVSTWELNQIAARELEKAGAKSAFLHYKPSGATPYPAVLCTSINDEVVHGIPSKRRILQEGDIIGIDFACFKDGYCADAARTVAVGVISDAARALISTTRQALDRAIAQCVPGARLGDIGAAVQRHAEGQGYAVVRDLVGHGIGRAMHEAPPVPNYGQEGRGLRLVPGLVIAIEPMICAGSADVVVEDDDWTISTRDRRLSAHAEHTVAITDDGPVILTAP